LPAFDNFSGFKEPSLSHGSKSSALSLLSSKIVSTAETPRPNNEIKSRRQSTRLQSIKKDPPEIALSPAQQQLQFTLRKKMLIKKSESLTQAFERFQPKVKLKRLSRYEVFQRTDDWSFLEQNQFPESINFRVNIIARRSNTETGSPMKSIHFLVRYIPENIIEDQWVSREDLHTKSIKAVAFQSLPWEKKLLIRDKLST
jgi:hypothetical protein